MTEWLSLSLFWGKREESMLVSRSGDWASGWTGKTDGEGRGKGFLWSLSIFRRPTLFSMVDLALHCGAALPTPVGRLQFRAPCLRSSVRSWGSPTRRYKLGHLFTSWSELVVVADSSGRNSRIRHKGPNRHASPSLSWGFILCDPSSPGVNLICYSRFSDYHLEVMFCVKPLIFLRHFSCLL